MAVAGPIPSAVQLLMDSLEELPSVGEARARSATLRTSSFNELVVQCVGEERFWEFHQEVIHGTSHNIGIRVGREFNSFPLIKHVLVIFDGV